jgi:uncharacterized protein (TIGR00645 family)
VSLNNVEKYFEKFLFASRWLLAPFYLGLMLGVVILLYKFSVSLYYLVKNLTVGKASESEIVLSILTLVDITLLANLLIIIIFSGYESFVSKIEVEDHEDRPDWMGKVGFSTLKIKLIGSIVAISGIELLKVFVNIEEYDEWKVQWKVIIHLTFVVSGVLFAIMDKTSSKNSH